MEGYLGQEYFAQIAGITLYQMPIKAELNVHIFCLSKFYFSGQGEDQMQETRPWDGNDPTSDGRGRRTRPNGEWSDTDDGETDLCDNNGMTRSAPLRKGM